MGRLFSLSYTLRRSRPFEYSYNTLVRTAKAKKVDCFLTYGQYLAIINHGSSTCAYCDIPLTWAKYRSDNGQYISSAYMIDRIVNTSGYKLGNIVPCCFTCNFFKRTLPHAAMLEIGPILRKHGIVIEPMATQGKRKRETKAQS